MGEFCVEGMTVGDAVGARLGLTGCRVGVLVVGMRVGPSVGRRDGLLLGRDEGTGWAEGVTDGHTVSVGSAVGFCEGGAEGAIVMLG